MAFTRNYRTPETTYVKATRPETEVGGVVRITLPEPPAFNAMIESAKRTTRRTPSGGWLKKAIPLYYIEQREYREAAERQLNAAGHVAPAEPWKKWAIVRVDFRLHQRRDATELLAAMKWPVDLLVDLGWVADDSPDELTIECLPTQVVDRLARGVDLYIRRDA
jgi:hypothetical protein